MKVLVITVELYSTTIMKIRNTVYTTQTLLHLCLPVYYKAEKYN